MVTLDRIAEKEVFMQEFEGTLSEDRGLDIENPQLKEVYLKYHKGEIGKETPPLKASISWDMPDYSMPSYSSSGYSMDTS